MQAQRKEPVGAIALQACKLVISESELLGDSTFEARAPWWVDSSKIDAHPELSANDSRP